jgi:hypothetical protein
MKCIDPPKEKFVWLEVIESYENLEPGYITWVRCLDYVSKDKKTLLNGTTHIENNYFCINYPKQIFKIISSPKPEMNYEIY